MSVCAIPCEDKWSFDEEHEHRTFLLDGDRFKIESGDIRYPATALILEICLVLYASDFEDVIMSSC